MNPKPGDVWLADLGLAAKTRPVVIVSREDAAVPRRLIIYVPFTTQNRGSPYEVKIGRMPFLHDDSVANVQGIGSIAVARLERRLGILPADIWDAVRAALRFALQL